MSVSHPARATCPRCSHEHDVAGVVAIHATGNAELRDRCLRGLHGLHACPACKRLVRVPLAGAFYSDFDRGELLYVVGRTGGGLADSLQRVPEMVDEHFRRAPGLQAGTRETLTTRIVCGAQGLRDKLVVLDLGFDDRAVEAWKLALLDTWGFDPAAHVAYVAGSPGEGVLSVVVVRVGEEDQPWEPVDERDARVEFASLVAAPDLGDAPWLGHAWVVDAYFGRHV